MNGAYNADNRRGVAGVADALNEGVTREKSLKIKNTRHCGCHPVSLPKNCEN